MPADYNHADGKISVSLHDLFDGAEGMKVDLEAIKLAWRDVMASWSMLQLSWIGRTKEEVEAFQEKISQVSGDIFGSSKDGVTLDRPGLYQHLFGLAQGASQNYAATDISVAGMFTDFWAAITDESPGTPADQTWDKPPIHVIYG
ncbi:hypothetical protein ABT369_25755 [Dactylosporangium sp. NPDC000244]|uniref:hypothetical protein n=1 Tax=Dactylosporangium sp. NPDC000244 TaxID=3154365 RepID=UPI0033346325